jgi:hypothetical protein
MQAGSSQYFSIQNDKNQQQQKCSQNSVVIKRGPSTSKKLSVLMVYSGLNYSH